MPPLLLSEQDLCSEIGGSDESSASPGSGFDTRFKLESLKSGSKWNEERAVDFSDASSSMGGASTPQKDASTPEEDASTPEEDADTIRTLAIDVSSTSQSPENEELIRHIFNLINDRMVSEGLTLETASLRDQPSSATKAIDLKESVAAAHKRALRGFQEQLRTLQNKASTGRDTSSGYLS